jgi:hypothetical protein
VSRELSALEKAGLIDKTRGALVLRDPGELNRRISAALEEPAERWSAFLLPPPLVGEGRGGGPPLGSDSSK